jgi:hypothetical protein
MDARSFVTSVYRLAPPAERPGAQIASQVDAAYLAAIGEVVRAYGELSAVELIGIELTKVFAEPEGAEIANVERLSDPESVAEELDQDGEAMVTITVSLQVDDDPAGVVALSLRLER